MVCRSSLTQSPRSSSSVGGVGVVSGAVSPVGWVEVVSSSCATTVASMICFSQPDAFARARPSRHCWNRLAPSHPTERTMAVRTLATAILFRKIDMAHFSRIAVVAGTADPGHKARRSERAAPRAAAKLIAPRLAAGKRRPSAAAPGHRSSGRTPPSSGRPGCARCSRTSGGWPRVPRASGCTGRSGSL